MPEVVHSLALSLATSELGSQLVLAHIAANWKERAKTKSGSKLSVVKSSDHSKGDSVSKQNCNNTPKQDHDDESNHN